MNIKLSKIKLYYLNLEDLETREQKLAEDNKALALRDAAVSESEKELALKELELNVREKDLERREKSVLLTNKL